MALGLLGVLDLSIITDTLIGQLKDCIDHSPLWASEVPVITPPTIMVTGSQPEAVRKDEFCQLSLYLFHVAQDKFQRNAPVIQEKFQGNRTGTRALKIPQQPLSLDLYYMLTAYAGKNYTQEQQA